MKEYTHKVLDIPEEMMRALSFQMGDERIRDHVISVIEETLNEMSSDGWEPLTPFGPPIIWFAREKKRTASRKKATKKTTAKKS